MTTYAFIHYSDMLLETCSILPGHLWDHTKDKRRKELNGFTKEFS